MSQRQVTEWSEREFVINRYNIWFGSDAPKTISAKEIIDNGIDQVADNVANKVDITVTKNSVVVLDNGKGISTRKSKSGKTHLFLAMNKLYTSSNYDGTDGLAGTNGVGATATNALSKTFKAGMIKDGKFVGYFFENGIHKDDGNTLDTTEDLSDFVLFDMKEGFYVEANYNEEILEDDINIDWILSYIKSRVGELPEGSVIRVSYTNEDGQAVIKEYNKIAGSKHYVKSWEELVSEVPSSEIVSYRNGWKYAFCDDKHNFNHVTSIVQGAPVRNPSFVNVPFEIEGESISVRVPAVFYYKGRKNPAYTDQTKRRVTMRRASYSQALKSTQELYKKYYHKAEQEYLSRMIGDSKSSMYYPASGTKGYKELIISEGYSAVSSIKNKRSYETQACFALRGKLLNVMQKDIKSAMKSDVIRDLVNVIMTNDFDKIIITPDADPDGAHICTLLLGVLARFGRKYLEEGKVYYCKTPLYVFEKGKDMKWSDKASDCPKGYSLSVKKGLGSLTPTQVKAFITDPKTRELYQFKFDGDKDIKALEFALIEGGKGWIAP